MPLQTSPLDLESLTNLYEHHLVSSRRIPLTTCPTWKLIEGLVKAFDENDDKTLTGKEKAYLLTTLASNPEIAIYRYHNTKNHLRYILHIKSKEMRFDIF